MKLNCLITQVLFALVLSVSLQAYAQQSEFTPRKVFSGHSEGDGSLRLFFGKQRPFHVESHGYELADSTFRLDQTVTFQGKSPQKRHWIFRSVSSNQFAGTLSDASGAVTGSSNGSHLFLRYRIKGPLIMHQTLQIMPNRRTIDNVGKITLFGIPVGRLRETITLKD
jgi:uncharacterized lipoprotein YehR (DUF1307 family)